MDLAKDDGKAIAPQTNQEQSSLVNKFESIDVGSENIELTDQEKLLLEERVQRYFLVEKKKRLVEEAIYIQEQQKTLKEEEKLYVPTQTLLAAGAIGGVGSVCIKLIGEENLKGEITQTSEPTNKQGGLLSVDLSEVSFGGGVEFIIYLIMSVFLGALSSFILIHMGGISTHLDNRRRCLASALLFGLFLPSSIQMMKQNFDSQITIESQQKAVQELKDKGEELSEKNAALTVESKEAIATLTQTEDIHEKPELKQKVLNGYIDVFQNVDEIPEQEALLKNIADVGRNNASANTMITQDAIQFLELVSTDKKYEAVVQELAQKEVISIRTKCDLEAIDCD